MNIFFIMCLNIVSYNERIRKCVEYGKHTKWKLLNSILLCWLHALQSRLCSTHAIFNNDGGGLEKKNLLNQR